jgi:hypothetical protein
MSLPSRRHFKKNGTYANSLRQIKRLLRREVNQKSSGLSDEPRAVFFGPFRRTNKMFPDHRQQVVREVFIMRRSNLQQYRHALLLVLSLYETWLCFKRRNAYLLSPGNRMVQQIAIHLELEGRAMVRVMFLCPAGVV